MTRSSYSNQIPRDQVTSRTCGLPWRPRLCARSLKGKKRRRQKGPAEAGGRRARVCAGWPQAGTPPRDGCGRAEEGGGYGPPRPGCTDCRRRRYPPTPARTATPSRALSCCARERDAHFPKFGVLTQLVAASSALQHFLPEILPGLPPPGSSQSLRPQGRGGGGSGPDSEGRKCRRGASRDL